MYFTLYRVFSSFHQHNFVSLSLSFCADVTGFVTEKTDGARDTKKTLIRTVYARNEGVFHLLDCQSLCTSLFCSFLPLALFIYFYFIVFFLLSFPSFISSFLSTILLSFFSFFCIPHPSSVIRSSPCATFLTPVLPPFRHTVCDCSCVLQRK